MWRILPGLVGQTGVTDLRQSPQGTPLLFPRRHPQLLVISRMETQRLSERWFAMLSSLTECLDSRRLLSASAFFSHGVLHVNGGNASQSIVVGTNADNSAVTVSIQTSKANGVNKNFNGLFPLSLGINRIDVNGGNGADTIAIDQTLRPFSIVARINGGNGNDTINAGDENDTIDGGNGNDIISAGNGDNIVRGGNGNDSLTAGTGNDRINGGNGNDSISAGDGNDTLLGGNGNDLLDAGAGDDLVYGGTGNDTLLGDDGNDRLWGDQGADSVNGGNGNDTLGGVLGTNTLIGGAGNDSFHVRSLSKDPVNDYSSTEDTLVIVPHKNDDGGGTPPVI
jgi:Ca2+-binding RTX toxin-like protein